MTKKKFITLFPYCEKSHLIKDIGQIPYFMYKLYDYDASIVTYKISKEYVHQEGEVKGLNLTFINNSGRFFFIENELVKYIFANAKKIDVFNLYHFTKHTFVYGVLYKMLNPQGFLYVKLDAYNEEIKKNTPYSTNRIKNFFLKRLEKLLLKKSNLFSIENQEGEELFKQKYPEVSGKTIYLPNGVNDLFLKEHFKIIKDYKEKENLIITTGRIGLKVKNNEMILRAIAKVNMKNWKMYFIGPVQFDFMTFFEELCKAFPQLKNNVFFTGEISDRKQLYEWYNKAKIFCLTSPFESFGISIIEAMYFGNYVIGTEGISSFNDISSNGQYGTVVKLNDYDQLAKVLEGLINNEQQIAARHNDITQFVKENFTWSKIVAQLQKRIV